MIYTLLIRYETININLASKPAWFVERNPKGQVPTLEKDGEIVYESRDCNQHLDEKFPDNNLTPQDPATRERHKQIADNYDKVSCAFKRLGSALFVMRLKTFNFNAFMSTSK